MNEEIGQVVEETTENAVAQAAEQLEGGIELTDTTNVEESNEEINATEEKEEEQPKGKFMTDEEIDNLVMKKVNRKMSKLEAKYEKELSNYRDTEEVLKAGLGATDIKDANSKLRKYYEDEGIKMPSVYTPGLSKRETEILARAEAEDIIEDGYDAMVEEANRLAEKKYENLNERERIIFNTLADKLTDETNKRELLKLGAKEEILKDNDFVAFKNKFNSNVPIKEIYEMYQNSKPKKDIKPIGSMKDTSSNSNEKDFYSPEDVIALTQEEWDKPGTWEKVRKSQRKW